MSRELCAIVAVGVGLAALILRLDGAVRVLGERMARLEGALSYLAERARQVEPIR